MAEKCPKCEGIGLRIVQREGRQFAEDCDCRIGQRAALRLKRAGIPTRYEHCLLEDYDTKFPGAHRSLGKALLLARGFVKDYPLEKKAGKGLLLTGMIGVGKTHLAVGILRSLIVEHGASGLFYDYRDLLKKVQNSFNPQVRETESEILRPVFEADVLVLDELGAAKPTDWVWDMVAHILNTRYNDKRTTIITTNYVNQESLLAKADGTAREETLGDRIGDRMLSRLQEMCVVVEMHGVDFRKKFRRAEFS